MTALSVALAQDITIEAKGGLDKLTNIGGIISAAVGTAFIISGIMVFAMLVWGGIQWIGSGGDKDATQKAKDRITHALVGLAIVASAWALTLIIEAFFGVDIIGTVTLPSATD